MLARTGAHGNLSLFPSVSLGDAHFAGKPTVFFRYLSIIYLAQIYSLVSLCFMVLFTILTIVV